MNKFNHEDERSLWQNYCIFIKETVGNSANLVYWDKNSLYTKWDWIRQITQSRTRKSESYLSRCTKVNWKWEKYFGARLETLRQLSEDTGERFQDTGTGNYFLFGSLKAQKTQARIDKLEFIKLKSFCIKRKQSKWRGNEL